MTEDPIPQEIWDIAETIETAILCRLKNQDEWHGKRDLMQGVIANEVARHCVSRNQVRDWESQVMTDDYRINLEILKKMRDC